MASIRISQLASVSAVTADDFLIVNDGDINTRKISYANFSAGLLSTTAASQTITGSLTVTGTLAATDLNIDSGVLSVVSSTNKVGINVVGPAYDLDIAGDAQIRGGNRLLLADTTNVHTVSLQAPGTLTSSSAYTLPTAYPASTGMALVSTTAGAMDWATILTDPLSGIGQMIVRNASNVTSPLSPGTLNQVLTIGADSVPAWTTPASGFADPMTTAGDIIIRNASNITTRLGIGTAGQTLVVSGGAPAWGTGAVVAGSNGQIQFNSSGSLGANGNLDFDVTTDTLETVNITAAGNLSASLVSSNWIPNTTGTKTLGSVASRWSALYVSAGLNFLSPDTLQTGQITYGDGGAYNFLGSPVGGTLPAKLNIFNGNNAYSIGLTVPNGINASYSLALPATDGTNGQVLTTDGSGALSFTTVSGGGAVTSVNGDTGVVTVTPASISALALAGGTMTGDITFAGSQTFPAQTLAVVTGAGATTATSISVGSLLTVQGDGASADGAIKLNCSQNSHGVTIQAPPHSAAATYTLTLPENTGTNGQFLTTDGSGVLSFTTASGGATPAGADTEIQFNSSGSFGANSNLTFNAGTNTLGVTAISTTQLTVAATLNVLGNTTLGAANTNTITFTGRANSNLTPLTTNSVDLGGPSLKWNNVYANLLHAGGVTYPNADGTAGQVLSTDGAGTLSFTTVSGGGSPGGATTQVQFNNAGAFAGDAGLTYNSTTDTLTGVNLTGTTVTTTNLVSGGVTYPTADGTAGQILSTDGSGTLSFISSSLSPGGATTQLQFNDGGAFGGDSTLTFNKTTNLLSVSSLEVAGVSTFNNQATFNASVIIGDSSGDQISINGRINTDLIAVSTSYDLGSTAKPWGATFTNALRVASLNYPAVDGAAGQVITTNGSGTLSFGTPAAAGISGEVMYNSGGSFAGESTFTYNAASNTLSSTNFVGSDIETGTLTTTALATLGSASVVGDTSLLGNVTLGNAITDTVTFTGRVNADFLPLATNLYDLGSAALSWNEAHIDNLIASDIAYPTSDGTAGQFLQTNGSGALSFVTASATPGGSDTQVQFKNGANFAGDAGLTYNSTTDTLTGVNVVATDVTTATLNTTGNVVFGDVAGGATETVTFNARLTGSILPETANSTSFGSSSLPIGGLTVGTVTIKGATTIGDANTDQIIINSRFFSDLDPKQDNNNSLGSASLRWREGNFVDTISTTVTTTNLVSGGLTYPTTDGTAGQILSTDGSGTLSFVANSTTPAGATTQIQFNNAGALAGDVDLTFNEATQTLSTTNVVADDVTAVEVTVTSLATLNANVVLGASASNTVAMNGRLGTDIIPTVNNAIDLGSPTAVFAQAHVTELNAGGVQFPVADGTAGQVLATDGAGNLDYVTPAVAQTSGTWTASLAGTTEPATLLTETGYWTRSGDLIMAAVFFSNVDTTGYAGTIRCTGLPFTCKNTPTAPFMGITHNNGMISTTSNEVIPVVNKNTTQMGFVESGVSTSLSWGTVGAGKYLRIQVFYMPE